MPVLVCPIPLVPIGPIPNRIALMFPMPFMTPIGFMPFIMFIVFMPPIGLKPFIPMLIAIAMGFMPIIGMFPAISGT